MQVPKPSRQKLLTTASFAVVFLRDFSQACVSFGQLCGALADTSELALEQIGSGGEDEA